MTANEVKQLLDSCQCNGIHVTTEKAGQITVVMLFNKNEDGFAFLTDVLTKTKISLKVVKKEDKTYDFVFEFPEHELVLRIDTKQSDEQKPAFILFKDPIYTVVILRYGLRVIGGKVAMSHDHVIMDNVVYLN